MEALKFILKPFASLRLTVILLAMASFVVLAGTWAQIDDSVLTVQKKYFHSFFCIVDMDLFLPRKAPDFSHYPALVATLARGAMAVMSRLRVPMFGGYSLIALLLTNLLAAHFVRFKISWKRTGIILIHSGLILLLTGEIITSLFAVESHMTIDEGQTVSYAEEFHRVEIAVTDSSPADHDEVITIPHKMVSHPGTISDPRVPFQIQVDEFYDNSGLLGPFQAQQRGVKNHATAGDPDVLNFQGQQLTLAREPRVSGAGDEADKIDMPSAYVTLSRDGKSLGTYLISVLIRTPQQVQIGDKTYGISLRFKRIYKPYSLTLHKFRFDRFTGTNTARNYSSLVQLVDPTRQENREVLIWMNHPLRYSGDAIYQQTFDADTEKTTVLQVVNNPGWMLPYISCALVALGLVVHFGMNLISFLERRIGGRAKPQATRKGSRPVVVKKPGKLWPGIITACCVLYLLSLGKPAQLDDGFDLTTFGQAPVSWEGRVMPIDSLARNSLRIISGKDELFVEDSSKATWFNKMFGIPAGKSYSASYWLLNTMANQAEAADYRVFRIDHPDILALLKLPTDGSRTRFSLREIFNHGKELQEQMDQIAPLAKKSEKSLNLYQKKVMELGNHVQLYLELAQMDDLYLAPPAQQGGVWKQLHVAFDESKEHPEHRNPGVAAMQAFINAYPQKETDSFNTAAAGYMGWVDQQMPAVGNRLTAESVFNRVAPFYAAMGLYVLVFLLICFSWLGATATFQRSALWVLILTLGVHTCGLIARIYIQGRPPVTNLYSSAIFIAWGVAVMCVGLELIYRNGVGSMLTASMGFISLLIAHNLAAGSENGDTMHMMRAVLDTNIWLATHVVVVTLGYAATFLAGFIAIMYVIRGVVTTSLDSDSSKELTRMVYGILCFAMLFSFVGTVLGGIWADQSWGRFWGWDPKENGAVLIVLWNALILHARWGGLVKARGLMNLAIFGNVVTSWSWFGTNMLGVGLHSYGFMDSAVFWLVTFMASQLCLIAVGLLPQRLWISSVATD